MTLGKRIRELRKAKGLTQRRLAKAAGIDFTYLSKIENERLQHTPSLKALQRMTEVLEADELELLELVDKMPPLLREIMQSREALQFFRKAKKVVKSPQGWRALSRHLDEMERESGKTRGSEPS